jgi:hypothetical protein
MIELLLNGWQCCCAMDGEALARIQFSEFGYLDIHSSEANKISLTASRPGYNLIPSHTTVVSSVVSDRSSALRVSVLSGQVSAQRLPAISSRAPSSLVAMSSSSRLPSRISDSRLLATTAPPCTLPPPPLPSSSPTLPFALLRPPVSVSSHNLTSPMAWSVVSPRF